MDLVNQISSGFIDSIKAKVYMILKFFELVKKFVAAIAEIFHDFIDEIYVPTFQCNSYKLPIALNSRMQQVNKADNRLKMIDMEKSSTSGSSIQLSHMRKLFLLEMTWNINRTK